MTLELNQLCLMDCIDGMKEISDKSVDLIITDPPYGIRTNHGVGDGSIGGFGSFAYRTPLWSPKKYVMYDDTKIPSKEYFDEMFRISKNQIIFGGNYFTEFLPASSCWIVWDKENTGNFADAELAWTSFKTAVRIFKYKWNGMLQEDMIHKERKIHPTQKPVPLFEWIIKNYAKKGDVICDPFFGSGSCLVAAVRQGHQFIGFEKEQSYFDAAQIRIKKAQEQTKIIRWSFDDDGRGWI